MNHYIDGAIYADGEISPEHGAFIRAIYQAIQEEHETGDQKPLKEGDTVKIVEDRRQFLNGRKGVIFDIVGPRYYVYFEGDLPDRERRAVFFLENLKRVLE